MSDLLIGIDGGGSKTDILLCDGHLNEVARMVTEGCNPNDVGIEKTVSVIRDGVKRLLSDGNIHADTVCAAFAGVAGITCADYTQRVTDVLQEILPQSRVGASHDGINVLYGAFPFDDGVSIICGTGSSCFVKKGNDIHRIGGYGRFDRCGNGFEIGLAAISHTLKTVDGRESRGLMDDLVEQKIGTDVMQSLDALLLMSKSEIASFARVVFEASEKGDKNAMMIIFENISYVAELVETAQRFFDGEFSVALAGGIFRSDSAVDLLATLIPPTVTLVKPSLAPVFGAAAKAKSL